MGREVRRVPADWEHPRDERGKFIPTYSWDMPQWPENEATHYMMYEDTSEGTPISPAFATKEELARWLTDTGASAFGRLTATYEQWLATIEIGFAFSAARYKS